MSFVASYASAACASGAVLIFLLECGNEGARRRQWIFGSERHANVGAFRGRGVGQNTLPAVAADEDRIEALTLRFLKDLEARRDSSRDEDDLRLSSSDTRCKALPSADRR